MLHKVMVVLYTQDYLEVKVMSLIADYDRETLTNLYQPFIGYTALGVYLTLLTEANNQKLSSLATHGQIFRRMRITPGDFITARKLLEAVGLLKTYMTVQDDTRFFTYEIYAPKTPKAFFDDALLYGLLIKMVGETEAAKIKAIYKFENNEDQGKDISASFVEVFNPNFDDPAFIKALDGLPSLGRNSGKIVSEFSYEVFFNELKKLRETNQIKEEAFSKKDMKEIERLATLNGVSEIEAAKVIDELYNPSAEKGKRIDFQILTRKFQEGVRINRFVKRDDGDSKPNLNSGKTEIARKINLMETVSPRTFLSILQNGTNPAIADLRLVDDISKNFNLPNCVINALIDYTLSMNNNVLVRAYFEKVAASLAREGVKTTIDAMNFLRKSGRKSTKGSGKKNIYEKGMEEVEEKKPAETKEENVSWDELLDDPDEGDPNGKA